MNYFLYIQRRNGTVHEVYTSTYATAKEVASAEIVKGAKLVEITNLKTRRVEYRRDFV